MCNFFSDYLNKYNSSMSTDYVYKGIFLCHVNVNLDLKFKINFFT